MRHCIIKGGYVVNIVIAEADWQPPADGHDVCVQDPSDCVCIGDWYEQREELFYRPLGRPNDLPPELQ